MEPINRTAIIRLALIFQRSIAEGFRSIDTAHPAPSLRLSENPG
jgi:hypothetical protein